MFSGGAGSSSLRKISTTSVRRLSSQFSNPSGLVEWILTLCFREAHEGEHRRKPTRPKVGGGEETVSCDTLCW